MCFSRYLGGFCEFQVGRWIVVRSIVSVEVLAAGMCSLCCLQKLKAASASRVRFEHDVGFLGGLTFFTCKEHAWS
jgi:hypothetical protein